MTKVYGRDALVGEREAVLLWPHKGWNGKRYNVGCGRREEVKKAPKSKIDGWSKRNDTASSCQHYRRQC